MALFDFLKSFMDSLPKSNFEPYSYYYILYEECIYAKDETEHFFNTERDLIEYISPRAAKYYYDSIEKIQDYTKEDRYDGLKDEEFPFYIPKDGIKKMGINHFAIADEYSQNAIVVNLEYLPPYESLVIENFILDICIDEIIKELSKLTIFKHYKKEVKGIGETIWFENVIDNINNIDQLKMYINHDIGDLYLLDGKLDNINTGYISINIDKEFPQFINLDVILEKTWCDHDGEIVHRDLPFQILQNVDWSITLVPQPRDVQNLISEQLKLWEIWTGDKNIYNDWWFPPRTMLPLLEFMMKNRYKTRHGYYIKEIYDNEKALEATTKVDNCRYEHCFADELCLIQMKELPDVILSDFITTYDRALVVLTDEK